VISSSNALSKEAEEKPSEAIKVNDVDKMTVAHGLLEIGRKRLGDAASQLAVLSAKRNNCATKRKRQIQSDKVEAQDRDAGDKPLQSKKAKSADVRHGKLHSSSSVNSGKSSSSDNARHKSGSSKKTTSQTPQP
jgi:hypothetical protein